MDISPMALVQQLARPDKAYVPPERFSSLQHQLLFSQSTTEEIAHSIPSNYPFLQNLFQSKNGNLIPRSTSPQSIEQGAPIARASTLPIPRRALQPKPFPFTATAEYSNSDSDDEGNGSMAPPPLPMAKFSSSLTQDRHVKHNTAPVINLHPPPFPFKRLSEPNVPTTSAFIDSSPVRMDLDSSFGSPFSTRIHSHPRSLSDSYIPSPPRDYTENDENESVHHSGASDRLADLFGDDLSPVRGSRKRFLSYGSENSPTPKSPSPPLPAVILSQGGAALLIPFSRRPFEKASSISSMSSLSRRRTSGTLTGVSGVGTIKGIIKRPSLASVRGTAMEQALAKVKDEEDFNLETNHKRQAQVATNGRPGLKIMRRAHSVADAFITLGHPLSTKDINIAPTSYRSSTNDEGYFSTFVSASAVMKSTRKASSSVDIGMMDGNAKRPAERGSPLTGFRTQEEKGKALPCFGVKEDGLMRITSATLDQLVSGDFAAKVARYLIIDCRFSYEFDGGHIAEAVNLPTTVDVEQALLAFDRVPHPSTSEDAHVGGKTVLIFHCEFSAKRAPTSAKHLRSKDRLLNVGCYPSVHYPEVYVLQGGYADFWKSFPGRCEGPRGYVTMDDPNHLDKRSVDLNAFRQQKRSFNRAKSFTFGEAHAASTLLQSSTMANSRPQLMRQTSLAPAMTFVFPGNKKSTTATTPTALGSKTSGGLAVTEEEHDGDSSFGTGSGSSPGGGGDSPCPAGSKLGNKPLKFGQEVLGRRPMMRAQTSTVLMFGR